MGQPPVTGGNFFDDPDEFDKLIVALGATWTFPIYESQDELSTGTEPFDEADDEVLDDLAPRSLAEQSLLRVPANDAHECHQPAETVLTRLTKALCIFSIVGAVVFVAIGILKVLAAVVTSFGARFSRFLRGG